jgi:hypothetical protein
LAALKRGDRVYTPASKNSINHSPSAVHETLALAERQRITAAKMEYVGDIEISQATIFSDTKSGNASRTIASNVAAVQQIACIRKCLGPGIGGKEIQSSRILLLDLGLQAVVAAASDRRLVAASAKVMSASDPRIHFGLGKRTKIDSLEITWPSGHVDRLTNVPIDQITAVKEGEGIIPRQFPTIPSPK